MDLAFALVIFGWLIVAEADTKELLDERIGRRGGFEIVEPVIVRETGFGRSALSSSHSNIDVIPPDVLTGFGDFIARSLVGLTTIGVGFFPLGPDMLDVCSKRFTR